MVAEMTTAGLPQRGSGAPCRNATIARTLRRTALPVLLLMALAVIASLAPATSVAAECPNEQLRAENNSTALPECRAYEKATPTFKNGGSFEGNEAMSDGPRATLGGLNNFAGTPGSGFLGNTYEFSRSESGWSAVSLAPDDTTFAGGNFETPLYRLGTDGNALFGLRTIPQPVDAETLYLRRGGSSAFEQIGTEAPPGSWYGKPEQETPTDEQGYFASYSVSADATHVVYGLVGPGFHNYLWPFDQTAEGEHTSLYEYAAVGSSQPFLVAVNGGEGSTALISGCGAKIGSQEDISNAVSEDGSTVFFTILGEEQIGGPCPGSIAAPAYNEIYARVDGEAPAAHTVKVSEPSHTECTACQIGAAEQKSAIFQGASEDGSKVFFLTEQELLPGNPGKNLYEFNLDGPVGEKVTSLGHQTSNAAAGVLGVTNVSMDGSRVYFVAESELTSAPNGVGATAQAGQPNLYVANTVAGGVSFVGTLASSESALWSTFASERRTQTTPNGQFLLFGSGSQLTPDDTSTVSQLFRYDAANGELVRISIGQDGFNDNGNTSTDPAVVPYRFSFPESYYETTSPQKMMTTDGSRIFFQSSNGLTPQAQNHVLLPGGNESYAQNIYEWHEGQISLISAGRDLSTGRLEIGGESSVKLLGTTSSGNDVLFTTGAALIPTDQDTTLDLYDARVDGGFPLTSSSPCFGEGCQGSAAGQPSSQAPATTSFVGPGNPKPHHKKKPHKKRHKKKQHKKRHKKHRKTNGKGKQGNKTGGSK